MAKVCAHGTEFSFTIQPLKLLQWDCWASAEIAVDNEFIAYRQVEKKLSADKVEEWIFSMFRFLAGAYKKEYSISFEEAGLAIDFYPYTKDGESVSREERRKHDCVMAIRMLFRGKKGAFLDGVYSLLLHREEIKEFALALRKEYNEIYVKRIHGVGKYAFAGVSPLGYNGCNYWYLDESNQVKAGDYVWVKMGSHNTEQIVFVDSVRHFKEELAPYPVDRVRRILRPATQTEIEEITK